MNLWGHQTAAVDFALGRRGTLLHMGMGTGKTRVALEVARKIRADVTLVVCPKSVISNWVDQVAQFRPEIHALPLIRGTAKQKTAEAKEAMAHAFTQGCPLMLVVNYETAHREPLKKYLKGIKIDLVIFDESHRIKNPRGVASRWAQSIARDCPRRLALTGTPMPHSPLDIFAQLRAIEPDVFGGSFVRFRERYAHLGGFQGKQVTGFQNLPELREKMSTVTFQADRGVLDLPSAKTQVIKVTPCAKARKMMSDLHRDFVAEVEEGEITASNALVRLLRLQQLTSGWVTVETLEGPQLTRVDTAKEDALAELFESLPQDEPVVVFGRFSSDLLSAHLAAARTERKSLELSGHRNELAKWQQGHAPILAVQIQSGGTGIDLTRSAFSVYLSTGFSLGDYEQSLARVHRPGQTRPVSYYHLVMDHEDSIDVQVHEALRQRKQVVEAVLDGITNVTTSRKST